MSTNVSIILLRFFRQPMNFDDLFKWLLTFFGLGNAKFITHTICEHMTNVPLPLSLLMRLLLFHAYGMTLGLRCTLSSCKFETVNQHNSFAFVCCHAYWLRIFIHQFRSQFDDQAKNTPVREMHIHRHTFYNVLASSSLLFFLLYLNWHAFQLTLKF